MTPKGTRRDLFRGAAAGALGIAGSAAPGLAQHTGAMISPPLNLTVKKIDATWINVPFRPVAARNMIRELPHWTVFVVYKVTLACGVVGCHRGPPASDASIISDQRLSTFQILRLTNIWQACLRLAINFS